MIVTFLVNSPDPSAVAKRLSLYRRGLKDAGMESGMIYVFRPARSFFQAYADPFILPFRVRRLHHAQLKGSDVILMDGFNWFSFFWFGLWYGRGKTKLVYELNEKPGTVYTSRLLELAPIKRTGLLLNRLGLKVLDGFIVISEPLRQYITSLKKGSASVLTLPIIIDTGETFRDDAAPVPDHPYFIHTGAMSQQKDGIVDIFKAFVKVNAKKGGTLHLYVSGKKDAPPGVWAEIDQAVENSGLSGNVHYLGYLEEDALRLLQKHSMFLVLPKPDNEQNRNNFATKLGEYLAFGKPVITTPVGDMAKYMRDGETALIVEPGNTDQIAAAMIRLMDDKALASRLGAAGKQVAEQEFNYSILGRRLADYFRKISD